MHYYDISIPLANDLTVYPGDPPVTVKQVTSIKSGAAANVSQLVMSSHSGTHIDPPRHYLEQGETADNIPLSVLMGEALVMDLAGIREINRDVLARKPLNGVERLLLKTDNSALWRQSGFCRDFAALTQDGASYLRENGIKLVGIDYLSIEPFSGDGTVHRILLEGGIVILEGLNLTGVTAGTYELLCLPLKVRNGDGAPARAVLRRHRHSAAPEFDPHTSKWPLA